MKTFTHYFSFAIFILMLASCSSANDVSKDGLSYENAIKVNDVAQEYKFIKEHCSGCKPVSQALTEHNGKPFDVVTVEKPDGTKASYYFDIKSFYGKF
jgi:hypothetical protein